MARLVADEDFPVPAAQMLRELGHDVLTIQEAGGPGRSDPEVLADATAANRAVLTHNHRHYRRLHARQRHAGIISCTRDNDNLPRMVQRIHEALENRPDLTNQFIRVIRPNTSGTP